MARTDLLQMFDGSVLIIDDDHHFLHATRRKLWRACTCLIATNGEEALELLRSSPEIAVVLLDPATLGQAARVLVQNIRDLQPHCRIIANSFKKSKDDFAAIGVDCYLDEQMFFAELVKVAYP